jgi:glyoxylase-like metal-dependent hydrolase (beta-lactamase superfamily II)
MSTYPSEAYEVYALKYAEKDVEACQFFYRDTSREKITLYYYFWCILGGSFPIVVDTGFSHEDAQVREVSKYISPTSLLSKIGVDALEVPLVIITHLHWDHWGGYSLFPRATFWVQREEVSFFTGPIARFEVYQRVLNPVTLAELVKLNYADKVSLIEGDRQVIPGIKAHWVGGHTAGTQIVTVQTARGTVVLASDASHFYRNIERREPVQIITHLPQMLMAFERIEELASSKDLIVVGHDPQVVTRFQQIEEGIIKIA